MLSPPRALYNCNSLLVDEQQVTLAECQGSQSDLTQQADRPTTNSYTRDVIVRLDSRSDRNKTLDLFWTLQNSNDCLPDFLAESENDNVIFTTSKSKGIVDSF